MDQLLLVLGFILFLLGLLVGFAIPKLAIPRMGLTSHLEGTQNGMFLILLGLVWSRVDLPDMWLWLTLWLAVYGTYANWFATFLSSMWGAGGSMMQIAAPGRVGTSGREAFIKFLLISLSIAMVVAVVLVLVGLIRA